MAFDVSKFLALTVLIAGTAAACSGSDDNDNDTNAGGESGSSTSGKAGQGNDAAGADAGGNGGAAVGGEGGGKAVGGAGGEAVGGGDAGGAGGAGGAFIGECLGSLVVGGAGGAGPDVEPSLEGLCDELYEGCPSAEAPVAAYQICDNAAYWATPGVAVAVAECIKALDATDICDEAKVKACYTDLRGRGCANPDSAAACAAMKARTDCGAIDLAKCEDIADLINADSFGAFEECMDPSIEGYYDETFEGTCVERLDTCAGIKVF